MQSKQHWEHIYSTRSADAVSWYQPRAERSLQLIRATGVPRSAGIIDVGGGASTLVDDLVAEGYSNLTVLDLSRAALARSKARLGEQSRTVCWIEGDVERVELTADAYEVWHDRAVFHFLTEAGDRRAYVAQLRRALDPGGHLIIATFAEDGPLKCSGLPVVRYGPEALRAELGGAFELVAHQREEHHTPFGTTQKFQYCHFRKTGP